MVHYIFEVVKPQMLYNRLLRYNNYFILIYSSDEDLKSMQGSFCGQNYGNVTWRKEKCSAKNPRL